MSALILNCFWNLASLEAKVREKATMTMIEALEKSECQFQMNENDETHTSSSVSTVETAELMERKFSSELIYTLKRLIRGLSSPRDGARQGFATALTEVIRMILNDGKQFSVTVLLQWLDSATEFTKSTKKSEEKDILFGSLFGIMALEQSGILLHTACTTMEDLRNITEQLIKISGKKSYLRESVLEMLIQMLEILRKRGCTQIVKQVILPTMTEENYSPETLILAIHMEQMFFELPWDVILSKSGLQSKIVSKKNLNKIAEIMKETVQAHPRVHTGWRHLLNYVPRVLPVKEFWNIVMEETLFDSSTSLEKKYLGMQLFEKILSTSRKEDVEFLFTPNFSRCLTNSLADEKNDLYRCAQHALQTIDTICQDRQEMVLPLTIQLLKLRNETNFGKSITRILTSRSVSMNTENAIQFIEHLKNMFYHPIEDSSG
jgi:DNA polymerase phi